MRPASVTVESSWTGFLPKVIRLFWSYCLRLCLSGALYFLLFLCISLSVLLILRTKYFYFHLFYSFCFQYSNLILIFFASISVSSAFFFLLFLLPVNKDSNVPAAVSSNIPLLNFPGTFLRTFPQNIPFYLFKSVSHRGCIPAFKSPW